MDTFEVKKLALEMALKSIEGKSAATTTSRMDVSELIEIAQKIETFLYGTPTPPKT